MRDVVEVVGPLSVHVHAHDEARVVALVFGHDKLSGRQPVFQLGQLLNDVRLGQIDQRVRRIQAQPVAAKVAEPHPSVVQHVPPHGGVAKVSPSPQAFLSSFVK